ncbi:MAG: hypothetical protein IPF54_24855 [Draconibacterium sp.]|nr:hypothetical protein [Draconibacterium sp.]
MNIKFVKKKIGNSYLIWFQNSNLYFSLEEPAWNVFRKIVKRCKSETIAKEFSDRYGLSYEESLKFVVEVRLKIMEMNKSDEPAKYIENSSEEINNYVYPIYSTHCYDMQNKVIEFSFETAWLENFIHPLIKHLETTEDFTGKSYFELFTYHERVYFRLDKKIIGSWDKNESHLTKGRIFIELVNVLHNKSETDWLMTVHASAISDGRKTILFSAAPGSGKSTIAALLQTKGYNIISDDFVPIERSTFKAFPFPIALSVKEGSLDLLKPHYPELENNPLITLNPEKRIKYLPIDNRIMKMVFPVKEFIFIKYDSSVDFTLEKIEPANAVKTLFEEAWIPPQPDNVAIFLDKIINISFYRLTYSNNKKALEAISQLFDNN